MSKLGPPVNEIVPVTASLDCVTPGPTGRDLGNHAVDTARGSGNGQRAVSVEADDLNDGFRLRDTPDDVEPGGSKYIGAAQRQGLQGAIAVRPRDARHTQHDYCGGA